MPNPFFDNRTSPNNVTEPNNPLNEDSKDYSRGFSTFNFSRPFYNTLRYADITPHECVEAGACKDKIPFGSKHEIRSHTLSSVMMSDIFMKKSYFAVDYRAFLPNSWSKILTHPINGDDIVASKANTVVINFWQYLRYGCQQFSSIRYDYDWASQNDRNVWANAMLHFLFLCECFYSNGSLISTLGCHGSSIFKHGFSFDRAFDTLISSLVATERGICYVYNGETYGFSDDVDYYHSPHEILDFMRHHFELEFFIDHADEELTFNEIVNFFSVLYLNISDSEYGDGVPFNYSRVCAYKMVTSNFYSNDKVDSIFTNHMWIDNQDWIWRSMFDGLEARVHGIVSSDYEYYYFNGVRCIYDVLSGSRLEACLDIVTNPQYFLDESDSLEFSTTSFYFASNFLYNLFSFDSSLRFGDYFTGSKTRPVAIGDTDLVETGEGVSTIEAIRRFSITRFLNQVGRVGPRLVDYVRKVLKGVPAPDVTIPRFLASSRSSVSGFEVENTADSQGNIVTLLRSSDSNYIYEVEVGEPCIIIGVTTFEVPRVYSRSTDKFFFHVDRFDMFNPFIENTGDQVINLYERALAAGSLPFSYTGRYMEYKQRVPYACGAFVDFLPSWLFVTDNDEGGYHNDDAFFKSLDSDFIRSKNHEMDRFYSSLTGYSLASYFHFIVKYNNICNATRQMQYNPQLM